MDQNLMRSRRLVATQSGERRGVGKALTTETQRFFKGFSPGFRVSVVKNRSKPTELATTVATVNENIQAHSGRIIVRSRAYHGKNLVICLTPVRK